MLLCPDTFFIHDWTIHIPSVPALTLWGGCQSREIMWHGRQGRGRWGGVSVSPLRRSWPPDSWDSTKHWVNIYLSYIFIGKEREQKRGRRAGGRRCCRCSMTGSQEREDTSVTGLTFHSLGPGCQERPLCTAHTLWWHQIEYKSCLLLADEHLSRAFTLRFIRHLQSQTSSHYWK